MFLRIPQPPVSSQSAVQASLREYVGVDAMHRLVDLAPVLEEIIVQSREDYSSSSSSAAVSSVEHDNTMNPKRKSGVNPLFEPPNSTFSHEEKTLWYAIFGK
jgi:hypothetical protein